MPYKARLQEGQERKRKKPTYRVTNCHEYNPSLNLELDIAAKQRRKRLARRLANGEDVTVMIDSTGLSFDRASQWYEEKYGKKAA